MSRLSSRRPLPPWPELAWDFGGVAFPVVKDAHQEDALSAPLYPVDLLSAGHALAGRRNAADRRKSVTLMSHYCLLHPSIMRKR